eukprot:scaffold1724_cov341-Pavlova_lutheri.AAC.14
MSMALDHLWMAKSRLSPAAKASSNAFCNALFCTGSACASPSTPIRVHKTAAEVHVATYIHASRRLRVGSDPSRPLVPEAQIFLLPRPGLLWASDRTFHDPSTTRIVAMNVARSAARVRRGRRLQDAARRGLTSCFLGLIPVSRGRGRGEGRT